MDANAAIDNATSARLFPLFADLRGRAVLVLGGGAVARRKVAVLLETGAEITVAAQVLDPVLQEWVEHGRLHHREGDFEPAWLDGVVLVVAASSDRAPDRIVAEAARTRGIFVNAVDDTEACTFHVPASVRRGRWQVAVSSGGAAPVLARRVRETLEAELDGSLGVLTELVARERARIRRRFPQPHQRRRFFQRLLDGNLPRLLRAGDETGASIAFERALNEAGATPRRGSVALVGAGPGDPGLLTLKALRALQDADVILHDRLVGPDVLDLARREAERIPVGKRVGEDHDAAQARIHASMLQHARAGKRVVRLQGGDPLVFGRGGEELDFLRVHGIEHEVIPGITAALASAAAARVPPTDRRHARSVTLLSPRGRTHVDREALAAPGQTLAIYMGVGELDALAHSLVADGRGTDTPCVLIEHASLPQQRVLTGTLAGLPALAREHGVCAPALLIVGEVAARTPHAARGERCRGETPSVAHAA